MDGAPPGSVTGQEQACVGHRPNSLLIKECGPSAIQGKLCAGAKQKLVVTIPKSNPKDQTFPTGTPTGMVSNGSTTDFLLAPKMPTQGLFGYLIPVDADLVEGNDQ